MKKIYLTGCFLMGCSSGNISVPETKTPPERDPGSSSEIDPGRRVRRLSADQFHRSLQVATGQSWSRYNDFAASLGKADFAEITTEGDEISVTFDKLVQDAARETCKSAVTADVIGGDVILRHSSPSDRGQPEMVENLKYLMMRFLGVKVDAADDLRLSPWLTLLQSGDLAGLPDETMALRWEAVCVGLATHPDFLTY